LHPHNRQGGNGEKFHIEEKLKGTLRFDDNPAVQLKGSVVDVDTGAVGALLSKTLYTALLAAKEIGVQFDRESNHQQWAFNVHLSKTKQALQSMLRACPLAAAPDSL
jgi:hypothetical protein